MSFPDATRSSRFLCRAPVPADAAVVHALVRACPPLDLNSVYAYLLICSHFNGTSVVAEQDGAIVGYVSAYLRPDAPTELFIWQVAVSEQARGQGLARQMIHHILDRDVCRSVRFIETTVTPDNVSSRRLFDAIATAGRTTIAESVAFAQSAFGDTDHAAEHLLRIGPLHTAANTQP